MTPRNIPAKLEHFIDGAPTPSADGATFEVADPVTNRPYATVAAGGPDDVDHAVTAAARAFTEGLWPHLPARERARILVNIADGIEARAPRIAELETFDTGLPITQARGQAPRAAENFRFFADLTVTLHEDAFRTSEQFGYVIRTPAGVAGLITPWNTPFMLATWKLAPALAAGCTVVLKPAEWTPLSASLLPEIMTEAGLPDGAFNLVHGIGEVAGAALVAHPRVPRISFTGETRTGRTIMAAAAPHLKGLSMELGGKSPCVIFADADLDRAIDSALFGVFSLNGERCTAGSRILAERTIYHDLVTRLATRAERIRVGDPADPETEIGALVHPEHYARVLSYVQAGLDQGARLVAGGSRPSDQPAGNYLAATVFADVEPWMRIFREEIFGPVVCVTPFDGEADAIALANDTSYGLAAYLWTVVTRADAGALYLRGYDELTHHNLILREGREPAAARLAFRVRTAADLDRAEAFYAGLGARTARLPAGVTPGVGESVRAEDPLGFTVEFFFAADHPQRLQQRYDLRRGAEPARLDHFNIVVPDVRAAYEYYRSLGFGLSETIEDGDTLYAAWMFRKQTVHDVAFTGGDGPRVHHLGFFAHESHQVLRICDILGSLGEEARIERGPGRHGVSNAFYVYLRDPDGHRVELYTSDYFTGDPDHPVLRWSVRDPRRRDFWGHAVIPSWYTQASAVLDLDGRPRPLIPEQQPAEVKVGADGFIQ